MIERNYGRLRTRLDVADQLVEVDRPVLHSVERVSSERLRGEGLSREGQSLSPREIQIVLLFADGLTSIEVATHLGTSLHTVKNQLSTIRAKLEAKTMAHVVALYLRSVR